MRDTAENIADLSDCKLAAALLEKKFKSTENDPSFPKGCYSYLNFKYISSSSTVQDSEVYWNEHSEGSKHRRASPICFQNVNGNVLLN